MTQLARGVEQAEVVRIDYNLYELPSAQQALRKLAAQVTYVWENKPLREAMQDLCATQRLTCWLDRRLDPSLPISMAVTGTDSDSSLGAALRKLATLAQAEFALIENVVYIGPTRQTRRLQRAAVELHDAICQQSSTQAAELRPLAWPELSTPNQLLTEIEDTWQVQIEGSLPHDLLHAGQLSTPATLATQLTIVCGGFERQATWLDDGALMLKPLVGRERWQTTYSEQFLRGSTLTKDRLQRLLAEYPGSVVSRNDLGYKVSGTTNFHLALMQPTAPKKTASDLARQRWSFEVQNKPAEVVLQFFASNLGLHVQWDSVCEPEQRQRLISFRVENADLDALLSAFAESSQLSVTRKGLKVLVSK